MVTLAHIVDAVVKRSGHALMWDEGVQVGPADLRLKRLLVCWNPDPEALDEAIAWGADAVIAHESLAAPYNAVVRRDLTVEWRDWEFNRQRFSRLEAHRLGFCRLHYTMDELFIFDEVVRRLGLSASWTDHESNFGVTFESPGSTLGEWIERSKAAFGLPAVRVAFAPGKTLSSPVHRVGLPWGGMGLFVNVEYQQRLAAWGCDLFIAGESDNFGMRFAVEQGISVVETSHDLNEISGVAAFAAWLREVFPELEVRFYEQRCVWEVC